MKILKVKDWLLKRIKQKELENDAIVLYGILKKPSNKNSGRIYPIYDPNNIEEDFYIPTR